MIGLAGAGAASFVLPQSHADGDDPDPEEDEFQPDQELEGAGNLLDFDETEEQTAEDALPLFIDDDFLTREFARAAEEKPGAPYEEAGPFYDSGFDDDLTLPDFGDMQPEPVALGDWVLQGPPAEHIDYESGTESLMLVWDDLAEGADEPEVRVEHDPDNEEVMHIVMNDYSIAEVHGDPDLSAEDVTVIPLSSALIVGLEPA
ncbi:MAG: hypothetical protein AAF999_00275 [Pseudomonadota bacterium]